MSHALLYCYNLNQCFCGLPLLIIDDFQQKLRSAKNRMLHKATDQLNRLACIVSLRQKIKLYSNKRLIRYATAYFISISFAFLLPWSTIVDLVWYWRRGKAESSCSFEFCIHIYVVYTAVHTGVVLVIIICDRSCFCCSWIYIPGVNTGKSSEVGSIKKQQQHQLLFSFTFFKLETTTHGHTRGCKFISLHI